MKTILLKYAALLLLATVSLQPSTAFAQGTAFTYQGRLNDGAGGANGTYDVRFALFDALTVGNQVGSPLTNSPVSVSNGLFNVALDFGANFPGADRWLEIGVRTNGNGLFTTLSPRQKITPSPYAIYAGGAAAAGINGTLPAANFAGTYGGAVTFNNAANNFSGNGTGLNNVNAATLGGLGAGSFWQLGGNAGTGGASLGTLDGQPLKLASGNARVMLLETKVVNLGFLNYLTAANILGGANINTANSGVVGATISGGGSVVVDGFLNTPHPNTVVDNFGSIGGGLDNSAGFVAPLDTTNPDDGRAATVSGGENNAAVGHHSAIGGGSNNHSGSANSVIAGGDSNNIFDSGPFAGVTSAFANNSCIGGGANNSIGANASFFVTLDALNSVISGGSGNQIFGASYAVILGGQGNAITGSYGLAAGRRAKVNHTGAFVWADSTDADFASTGNNQFLIRAGGGVGIGTAAPLAQLAVNGNTRIDGQGANYAEGLVLNCPPDMGGYGGLIFHSATRGGALDGTTVKWDVSYNYSPEVGVGTGGLSFIQNNVNTRLYLATNGNVGIGTTSPSQKLNVIGNILASGTVTGSSDRNVKEHFSSVNPRDVLEKVSALPITEWNYIADGATQRHIGPMAQDFYSAFNVGLDDKHISMVDADGVALAAIQGLNQKVEEQRAENAELKRELSEIKQLLAKISGQKN